MWGHKNSAIAAGLTDTSPILSIVYLHTIPVSPIFVVAPDIGPINSSLRVLSVNVSEGSAAVTMAFDVRYMFC